MSNYNVGDKVRIRRDLKPGSYGGCWANSEMCRHAGEIVTVKKYNYLESNRFWINERLSGCLESWHWSNEMVEPVVEEKKVFTKNDLKTGMFGVTSSDEKFVVVGDHLFYSDGGWDRVSDLNEELKFTSRSITKVYEGVYSFTDLDESLNGSLTNHTTLVYDRERDTKPLYNGKVVCIDNSSGNRSLYTVGKIYQCVNGSFVADNGEEIKTWYKPFHSFEEFQQWSTSKWLEIKE